MNKIKAAFLLFFVSVLFFVAPFLYAANEREEITEVEKTFMPKEVWHLPIGTRISCTIQNAIFSFNLITPVIAIVDEPVLCPSNGKIVMPRKTKLIGTASILKSDDRVNITFNYAVLPNGRQFEIGGIALSPDGSAGIKGAVKEYKDTRLMASAMSGALVGVGQAMSITMTGQPIMSGAIGGALQQGAQQAQEISNQKVDVSISVGPFQKTSVFLSSRLVLDGLIKQEQAESTQIPKEIEKDKKSWREE